MTAQAQTAPVFTRLPFKAKLSYAAHLFKALTRQHHLELLPLLSKYIPKDGVVIDVGAHAGQFTKLFARLAPQGQVYAFEPASYARSIITKVISIRGLKNVSLFPVGLSDAATTETLVIPIKPSGATGFGLSHFGEDTSGRDTVKEQVTLTTLDRFAADQKLTRVDLIKADIEGWEMHMLKGGKELLAKFRPVLVVEVSENHLRRAGSSAAEMMKFLSDAGYDAFDCDFYSGKLTPPPVPFVNGNLLCLPRR